MHRVDKIRFTMLNGKSPEAPCHGYMELDRDGDLIALYDKDGQPIDLYGGHEFVRVKTLGRFDDEDRDHFYDLLESDGAG